MEKLAVSDWLPISEAPKDGTIIEVYNGWHERALVSWTDEYWMIEPNTEVEFDMPILWKPISPLPIEALDITLPSCY